MRAVLSAIAAALVVTAFAYGATPVSGNLTLASFDPKQACKFMSTTMPALPASYGPAVRAIAAGSKVLLAQCSPGSPATKFTGAPATRTAGYGWNWWLAVGKNGKTTGLAVELGNAVLVPPTGTQLTLQLVGVQHPVGPQTSSHAKGLTTGTWTLTGGKGSGSYTFKTERKGSMFTTAVVHLSGSLG
jgi:hypothetical protein